MTSPWAIRRRILREAISLLKKGWTTGVHARNKHGRSCAPTSKSAVCWCADGAIIVASGDKEEKRGAWGSFCFAAGVGVEEGADWNDSQKSSKPVIAAMRKALKEIS